MLKNIFFFLIWYGIDYCSTVKDIVFEKFSFFAYFQLKHKKT